MTHAHFPERGVTLRDGRVVHVRAMLPTDEKELLQGFARMGDNARYMRFMRAIREVNLERLREVLHSFPESGAGIVATVPAKDGVDIAATAIYVIEKNPMTCEFAITVGSEFGGVGLASTLMTMLIDSAKLRGLRTMEGFVLAVNEPMLRVARRLGFSVAPDPDDGAIRICRLNLDAS